MPNDNEYFGGGINPVGGFGLNGGVGVGNIGINPIGAFNAQGSGFNSTTSFSDLRSTGMPAPSVDTSTGATSTTGDTQGGAVSSSGTVTPTSGSSFGGGTTPSSFANSTIGGETAASANFAPNALHAYAQVAYHWRFITRGDGLSGTGNSSNIVIAESGVTGYNIREVVIDSVVAPNSRTKNTSPIKAKIVIVEPMGASFLDGMYEAAVQQQGVKNWQHSRYVLELSFLGYDSNGAPKQITGLPNGGKWSWEVAVNDIDVHLETGGGVYTLDCVVFDDTALRPEWMNVQEKYNIKAKTVGEYFSTLCSKMNHHVVEKNQYDLVNYQVKFHAGDGAPSAEQFKLQDENGKELDPISHWSMTEADREVPTQNLMRGTQIGDLVEWTVSATKEGQELVIFGKSQGGALVRSDSSVPNGEFRDSVLYRVYPQVIYTGYHDETGNYKRTVIFHVKPFRTQATTYSTKETTDQSKAALQAALPRTKKKYEYIYTGLNVDVLNFDIKFNVAWQAVLPRLRGGNYYNETTVHHARYDPEKHNNKHLGTDKAAVANAQQQLSQAGNLGLRDSAQGALEEQRATSQARLDGAAAATSAAVDQLNTARIELFNGLPKTEAQLQALNQKITALQNTIEGKPTSNVQAVMNMTGSTGSDKYAEELVQDVKGAYTKVSIMQNAEGARRAAGTGVTSHRSRHRSIVGAMLNQVYDPNVLLNIELEIMGDPYWLGGPTTSKHGPSRGNGGDVPNFEDGDVCFALYFRYPFGIDSQGAPTFRDQDVFNGLYRAIEIKHNFVGGKFSQTIKALRMDKVHPKDMRELADSPTTTPGVSGGGNTPAVAGGGGTGTAY